MSSSIRYARAAAKRGCGAALLDEALKPLELLDERQARMIEQRYLGGLSLEEIAGAMGV